MAKYTVSGTVTIGIHTVVEASSPEEALEIAQERELISLCHQCGGTQNAGEMFCTSGELDGAVTDLKVDRD